MQLQYPDYGPHHSQGLLSTQPPRHQVAQANADQVPEGT